MCGILAYVGERDASPLLLQCLKRLEYRGYDSAGIGLIQEGRLSIRRSVGRVSSLERVLEGDPLHGRVGVAHTRWATHGTPSAANAHPHSDCSGSIAVVHNGIIENYRALKTTLVGQGHRFSSETDTEVVPHLIEQSLSGDFAAAMHRAKAALSGAYALGVISPAAGESIFALRSGGPPLVVGLAGDGLFLASDITAILDFTREVVVLEDGEMALLSRRGLALYSHEGLPVDRPPRHVDWDAAAAEKNGFPHFMLKEIHEQPTAISDTLRGRVDLSEGKTTLPELGPGVDDLGRFGRVLLTGCGTSWHAGLVGKQLIERFARIPAEVDVASELRYRDPVLDPGTLTIAISQSGETADTLGAAHVAAERGSPVVAVCNVVGSSLARGASGVLFTRAGPEIGVASTKAFTSQVAILALFAIHLGLARRTLSRDQARGLLEDLLLAPGLVREALGCSAVIGRLAERLRAFENFLFLGRGPGHPFALEGALKLKEISYVHAEGYPAGEMKHGPIALIDEGMPVVVLAPPGRWHPKVVGAMEEVRARGGLVVALATQGDSEVPPRAHYLVGLPQGPELSLPLAFAVPLQVFAYAMAVLRGCNVDQPRNLAKSVTVE
jgi:glucosamine--fructose-6-phosphate aminotransferase (isomerizing)